MRLRKSYRIITQDNAAGETFYIGQYRNIWSFLWHNVVDPNSYDAWDDEVTARIKCLNHSRGSRYKKLKTTVIRRMGLM